MGMDKNTLIILLLPLNNVYGALFIFFNFSETTMNPTKKNSSNIKPIPQHITNSSNNKNSSNIKPIVEPFL